MKPKTIHTAALMCVFAVTTTRAAEAPEVGDVVKPGVVKDAEGLGRAQMVK